MLFLFYEIVTALLHWKCCAMSKWINIISYHIIMCICNKRRRDWQIVPPFKKFMGPPLCLLIITVIAQIPLGSSVVESRLDTTRHVRRVKSTHFGCVELVEEQGSTRSTRRTRLALHADLYELDTSNVSDTPDVSSRVETWRDEPSGIWAYIDKGFFIIVLRHNS